MEISVAYKMTYYLPRKKLSYMLASVTFVTLPNATSSRCIHLQDDLKTSSYLSVSEGFIHGSTLNYILLGECFSFNNIDVCIFLKIRKTLIKLWF